MLHTNPALEVIMRHGPREGFMAKYLDLIRAYVDGNVRILTYWDEGYPVILRSIPNPPLILYIRGKVFPGNDGVAIVGTRVASERGRALARKFGRGLAEEGYTVISGLASGVDAAAHEGALDGGGVTIAVLAGDVDRIYPNENVGLARRVTEQGSLVSEITPQAELRPGRFVERNRITSGLAHAVLIIETGKTGGTIRQAEYARAQKRPIYVVDHGRFDRLESEEGFRSLVRAGAIPVREPSEVSELLSPS